MMSSNSQSSPKVGRDPNTLTLAGGSISSGSSSLGAVISEASRIRLRNQFFRYDNPVAVYIRKPEKIHKMQRIELVNNVAGARPEESQQAVIYDLQKQLDEEINKNRQLEAQFKYRVGSFVKREAETKKTVEALEKQLQDRSDEEHYQRMQVIRNMHDSVVTGLEGVQNSTAKVLQEQEKDLMRSFRARLQDLNKELENQKAAKGDYSAELQAKYNRVLQELEKSQELAAVFDKKNQQFIAENQKLQELMKTRADDRAALVKELVGAKKQITALKKENTELTKWKTDAMHRDNEMGAGSVQKDEKAKPLESLSASTRNKAYERELTFRETIQKLKRMLEHEKKQVRSYADQNSKLLQKRTELEFLLRQCVDDVKLDIAKKQLEHARFPGELKPESVSLNEMTAADRERVLELLLSQQRVVQLLYEKTFPDRPPTQPDGAVAVRDDGVGEDAGGAEAGGLGPIGEAPEDYKWLENVIGDDGEQGGGA